MFRTGDGFDAGRAALGEQLAEAVGAGRRLLVAAGEALAGQAAVAVGAGEALPVPGLLLVRHAARGDDLWTGGRACQTSCHPVMRAVGEGRLNRDIRTAKSACLFCRMQPGGGWGYGVLLHLEYIRPAPIRDTCSGANDILSH